MASTLCQKWIEKLDILSKTLNFVHFGSYNLVQLSPGCGPNLRLIYQFNNTNTLYWYISLRSKYLSNNVLKDIRLPVTAFVTVERNWFSDRAFYVTSLPLPWLLMLTLDVLRLFIHYLISIWTTFWWNFNKTNTYVTKYTRF